MSEEAILTYVLTVLAAGIGVNFAFWSAIGLLRYATEHPRLTTHNTLGVPDVAVVIPAHNEEIALPKCIEALCRIVSPAQIYLASDGSHDRTAQIARSKGCSVLEIRPNGGKARALHLAIAENRLCERYKAILIQDADSEIDPAFFVHALPLFDDANVVVVAGHVMSRWPHPWKIRPAMLYTAYRTRLYRILQAAFQYGMSWKPISVSYIAPGFTSMYRTSVLDKIEITAPGLVIEDFNMTFEVQRKRLGRIAYSPQARCTSEDPCNLRDYKRQVARWYLGFWQTVRRHGFWPGKFWAALVPLLFELIVISLVLLTLPALVILQLLTGLESVAWSMVDFAFRPVVPLKVLAAFVCVDYLLTIIVALVDRRLALLLYGALFPLLRLLDAALFLCALVKSFSVKSDGRWISPRRHNAIIDNTKELSTGRNLT